MARASKKKNAPNGVYTELQPKYDRACVLESIHTSCRPGNCRSNDKLQHCPECAEHLQICRDLDASLNLKPWNVLPLDPDLSVEEARSIALEPQ